MFGFRYMKVPPTTFAMQFRNGVVRREGTGISFFYFEPRSTIVVVPAGSTDVPFMFQEPTADFQTVAIQGHLAYRVADPRRLAALLDYSVKAGRYVSDDPQKLAARIAHAAQAATRAEVQARALRAALVAADEIAGRVYLTLRASPVLKALGVEVLDFAILALRPAPETGRALEAQAREQLLKEADDAVYERRNSAVEQERRIKENELDTELAVEAKRREIAERELAGAIALEDRRKALVAAEAENRKAKADALAYATDAQLRPLRSLDAKSLQVLAAGSLDPEHLVAMAFQEIAGNAAKIGTLNVSPELLDSLIRRPARPERAERAA